MPEPLIDQKFLERLERLTLHWQKSFPGLVGGHNRSRFSGAGQEFLDHRGFFPGDDLRAINWRAFMRLEKLLLKLFQVEPRVPVRMLIDTSASMLADGGQKFDFARKIAASLCYVGLVRLDTIEVLPFAEDLHEGKACGGGRHRFSPISRFLGELNPKGHTRFTTVVDQRLLGRSLTAIVDARITTTSKFDDALRRRDDVVWAAHVTGVPDVKVMVACNGTQGLDDFLQWLHKQGATDTRTDVVLRPIVGI
mgnify:CR=1 FL=1